MNKKTTVAQNLKKKVDAKNAESRKTKLFARSKKYEPVVGERIPPIREVPTELEKTHILMIAASGLNVEVAASYAKLPSSVLKNWLLRGYEEQKTPFDSREFAHNEELLKYKIEHFNNITMPCLDLYVEWKKARALFILQSVKKIQRSRAWQAQTWLLERIDPASFVAPNISTKLRRDLQEGEIIETAAEVLASSDIPKVTFVVPDNTRGANSVPKVDE